MAESVIVAAKRSAIGKFQGSLSPLSAMQIGSAVARETLNTIGAKPQLIDEVWIGQVLQGGCGQNPARQVALGAGFPDSITAVTVNQVCGSSLQAVMTADRAIRLGDISTALCGGIESMSNPPHFVRGLRSGANKFGHVELTDMMLHDGLTCPFTHTIMGCYADKTAAKHNISREAQDEYAAESHRRAAEARGKGVFAQRIIPIEVQQGKTKTVFNADETIREEVNVEQLAKLRPAFTSDGTVTAGNASTLSDGAAMVLVASPEAAKKHGWKPEARILSQAVFGTPPEDLFIAPVGAIRLALERANLSLKDMDLIEINEAFAAQMLACIRLLDLDHKRVNVLGGGVALGHPIGASGARVLVTLLNALTTRNLKRGVASLCLGGGNAVAVVIERM
jgi:acetyl-CoA C-acetyltransferase